VAARDENAYTAYERSFITCLLGSSSVPVFYSEAAFAIENLHVQVVGQASEAVIHALFTLRSSLLPGPIECLWRWPLEGDSLLIDEPRERVQSDANLCLAHLIEYLSGEVRDLVAVGPNAQPAFLSLPHDP
jgi:hypothetical protein